MDPQHHLQRNRRTNSSPGGLVIHGLDQGQKFFSEKHDLPLIQEALAIRPLFEVDLLEVRGPTWKGIGYMFESKTLTWASLSDFFSGISWLDIARQL